MNDPRSSPWSGFGPSVISGAPEVPTSDGGIDEWVEPRLGVGRRVGWLGWRLRLLVAATLVGCVGLLVFIRWAAVIPVVPYPPTFDATQGGAVITAPGSAPKVVIAVQGADAHPIPVDSLLFERPARWIVDDARRTRYEQQHDVFARALAQGQVTWTFADASTVDQKTEALGARRLGVVFWLTTALALALYLVVAVIFMARPTVKNGLFALAALPQSANLLFIAAQTAAGMHLPEGFAHADHGWRMVFDVITCMAIVHSAALHPRPLPWVRWMPPVLWGVTGMVALTLLTLHVPYAWWIGQGFCIALGLATLAQFEWSYRTQPHPLTLIFKRFGFVTLMVFVMLSAAVAATGLWGSEGDVVGAVSAMIWVVFIASVLLATPFMSRSQPMIREFSMLAGVSTMATALDLLFVAAFSLSAFSALTLALFLSLMVYAGVRQWILNHMLKANVLTTERMFEQLYRIARDVETHPQRLTEHVSSLLRELYDPIELAPVEGRLTHSRVSQAGAALLVPMPAMAPSRNPQLIALRYAHRGKQLFTPEDARLTDRIVEQLTRAVAFDQAVERGRTEERVRIAQDLHDDIGARLLTLMYKAPNSEMEEYIRHTLHELKTLTRGLAAKEHRLSHAIGEWKADITSRLTVARCELDWSFTYDDDVLLNVVQWSALTRILRELINNVIAHGKAGHVWLDARLMEGHLRIRLADDGAGRSPQQWRAGLGLGGVRKRVKQLAGHVRWDENTPSGIVCVVDVRLDVAAG